VCDYLIEVKMRVNRFVSALNPYIGLSFYILKPLTLSEVIHKTQ
jgi:hypothetical protein